MANCTGDSLVRVIDKSECIGNSLQWINANFKALDLAVCESFDITSTASAVNGILKSNGAGVISRADPGVDYYVPGTVLNADLRVTGDITAFYSSDERLKTNINKIPNALDKVSSLQGVEYEWNTELQNFYSGEDVGVIAQEVEKVLPAAVVNRENGYKAVRYERLVPLLIEAIKELKTEIETLKAKQ